MVITCLDRSMISKLPFGHSVLCCDETSLPAYEPCKLGGGSCSIAQCPFLEQQGKIVHKIIIYGQVKFDLCSLYAKFMCVFHYIMTA